MGIESIVLLIVGVVGIARGILSGSWFIFIIGCVAAFAAGWTYSV